MTTFYVSKDGNDASPGTFSSPKLSVKEGLNCLQDGDILYVLAGTYTENFVFTNRMRDDHAVWLKTPKVIAYPNNSVVLTSTSTSESRTLAYFSLQGLAAVQDPANYGGVSFMDVISLEETGQHSVRAFAFSVGGPSYRRDAPSDLVPPTITITSHAHMDEVYGAIDVIATANDDTAIDSTWLKIDGEIVHSEEPETDCVFSWDTTLSLNGEHVLQAFAKDTSGNIGVSPTVTVVVNNVPPIEEPDPSLLTPSITVTCPWGIEKWKAGINVDLTWDSIGVEGNLDVFLLRDGLPHQIFGNIPNTGTVLWTVEGHKTPNCQIQIKSINNLNVMGLSEFFELV